MFSDETEVGANLVLNPALRRALLLSNLQRAHARHDEQDGKHRRELNRRLGTLKRILGRRQHRQLHARKVFDRVVDPEEQVDDEVLESEVQDALHGRRQWRGQLLTIRMLDRENRANHRKRARVEGEHQKEAEHCQALPKSVAFVGISFIHHCKLFGM